MSSTAGFDTFNFTGGIPSSADFVPSLIFLGLYVAIVPLLIWAFKRTQMGYMVLIRPTIFVVMRLAFFGIRCYLAKNTLTTGLVEADLILVLVGFIFIVEPAVAIWKELVQPHFMGSGNGQMFVLVTRILRLVLLGAIITGVLAGTSISSAINDPSKVNSVKNTRRICYWLCFAVAAVLLLANGFTMVVFARELQGRISIYLAVTSVLLVVIAVYRIIDGSASSTSAIASKALFYILQILLEWIATICILLSIVQYMKVQIFDPNTAAQTKANSFESTQSSFQSTTPAPVYPPNRIPAPAIPPRAWDSEQGQWR